MNASLPCTKSGLCSVGSVRPFTGDVAPLSGLLECLAARAYKKEVILIAENRLVVGLPTLWNALAAGYAHVVLFATAEKCAKATRVWPDIGCAWSSKQWVSQVPDLKYYVDRLSLVPRMARLGYNVLMVDSDVLFLEDVYSHLKAQPLRDVQLLALRDPYNGFLNCAIIYIQNARPDGPAVQMLAEVPDRIERWAEGPEILKSRGRPPYCWDQMVVSDSLLSVIAGRPITYGCWSQLANQTTITAWEAAHMRFFGGNDTGGIGVQHYMKEQHITWPESLADAAPGFPGGVDVQFLTQTIKVPNTRGSWPEELGGSVYPGSRSIHATAWIDMLKADGLPLWPDPEDPAQAAAAAANTETFAFLPPWIGIAYSQRSPAGATAGNSGYWNPALLAAAPPSPLHGTAPASPFALVHVFHPPGGPHMKQLAKMATGHFPWELAHRLRHDGGLYIASTPHVPVPDVLSYTPEVEGREWASEEEWNSAARALARLAMEMGRAAAYPAPRCNLTWLGGIANNQLPLQIDESRMDWCIPYARAGEGFSNLRCMLGGYLMLGCLESRWYFPGGLLAPEFDDFVSQVKEKGGGVASIPADLLQHPPATTRGSSATAGTAVVAAAARTAWGVEELAATLMSRHGGPGSGLHARPEPPEDTVPQRERPRLLLLDAVPVLTDKVGPRALLYQVHEGEGEACPWIHGKPFT